ncbi:MAG: hypothetical protein WCI73_03430 [Phycisphaerae bacterium]
MITQDLIERWRSRMAILAIGVLILACVRHSFKSAHHAFLLPPQEDLVSQMDHRLSGIDPYLPADASVGIAFPKTFPDGANSAWLAYVTQYSLPARHVVLNLERADWVIANVIRATPPTSQPARFEYVLQDSDGRELQRMALPATAFELVVRTPEGVELYRKVRP